MWLLPCPIPHACNHLAFYQCGGRQLTKLLDHFDLLFSLEPLSQVLTGLMKQERYMIQKISFDSSHLMRRCSSLVPPLACYGFFFLAMASSDRKLAKVGLGA